MGNDHRFDFDARVQVFTDAVRTVTSHLKIEIGILIEALDAGCATTGSLRLSRLDDGTLEEIRAKLIACREVEIEIGPCPAGEFEILLEQASDELIGPLDFDLSKLNAHVDWSRRDFDEAKVTDLVLLAKGRRGGG